MRLKASIVFLGMCFSQLSLAEEVKVVATIKPLQLLAADIVGDTGRVDVLIPPGASPHHYSMKPSDRRKLDEAGLVAWVGPDLETFLVKTLSHSSAPIVAMMADEAENDHADEGHEGHGGHTDHDDHKEEHASHHDEHETEKHHGHDEHHEGEKHHDHAEHADHHEDEKHDAHEEHAGHDHGHDHDSDPHLWLDPIFGLKYGKQLSEALSARYPAHADQFKANFQRLEAEVLSLDKELKQTFKPLQDKGFFVFHDAWGHFVGHYGLKQLGYFTVDPGRKPGAKHMQEIRNTLESQNATCVFSEPQFKPSIIRAVTSGLDVRSGELDPLAIDVSVQKNGYAVFLRGTGEKFSRCLSEI